MSVAVLGAGAFGTALAAALGRKMPVWLWARSHDQARAMREARENAARLPGVRLPDSVRPTADLADTDAAEIVLLAMPMQRLRGALEHAGSRLAGRRLVACCKGIELETGLGPVSVLSRCRPDAVPALLTGPSFAVEIARGLPTALTLACADEAAGRTLQVSLSTPVLRLYRTTDWKGAELGGALKNVMAIACGAAIGAGLGNSARAALMTRGYAEMVRVALARGARPETLAGLSGLGDLALTCTSDQSRNYRLGLALGRGDSFDASITVEGAATARALVAAYPELDIPVTRAVVALLNGTETLTEAMERLLARTLKPE